MRPRLRAPTHTYTHTYIYIYICLYKCIVVECKIHYMFYYIKLIKIENTLKWHMHYLIYKFYINFYKIIILHFLFTTSWIIRVWKWNMMISLQNYLKQFFVLYYNIIFKQVTRSLNFLVFMLARVFRVGILKPKMGNNFLHEVWLDKWSHAPKIIPKIRKKKTTIYIFWANIYINLFGIPIWIDLMLLIVYYFLVLDTCNFLGSLYQ